MASPAVSSLWSRQEEGRAARLALVEEVTPLLLLLKSELPLGMKDQLVSGTPGYLVAAFHRLRLASHSPV